MVLNTAIIAAVILTAVVLLLPRFATAPGWRAAITPLASIIGSGFLVLGPILDTAYGYYAPLVMAALCLGVFEDAGLDGFVFGGKRHRSSIR